ncbi:unnamed protein product [Effrenium voratum]|nr:unnamed protein product [Effrenium voratum]CAJ1426665.1 unnamed protein product [Effrenium voratum]
MGSESDLANLRLQEEVQRLTEENAELKRAAQASASALAELRRERDTLRDAAQGSPSDTSQSHLDAAGAQMELASLRQERDQLQNAQQDSEDTIKRLQHTIDKLHQESHDHKTMAQEELRQLQKQNEDLRQERDRLRDSAQASPNSSSESRLRAVMTSGTATVEELRHAIASVEAVLDEAKREMERKQLRERRAAYEQLHHALDKADEELLEVAIEAAKAADVDDEDILKAQNKLLELQMMSPEERAARAKRQLETQQKKDAFQMVKKDDAEGLAKLLDGLDGGTSWQDWRDYAGRTLVRCAGDLRAPNAQVVLAERTKKSPPLTKPPFMRQQTPPQEEREQLLPSTPPGAVSTMTEASRPRRHSMPEPSPREESRGPPVLVKAADFAFDDEDDDQKPEISEEEAEKLKAQALRAVVQDDCISLAEVLKSVRRTVWSRWENKAGKDLLTLSQERGSSSVYSLLAKCLGMVKEVKREFYEERQTVWVFVNGDVQPRRATVLEDTPEECDDVLLEFWDGDDPPARFERCLVRAMWS